MKRIHIIGIAFAAIFAFSVISVSGASAFTLWDQCAKVAAGTGKFLDADCSMTGTGEWEWLEITAATKTDSLLTTLTLTSSGVVMDCEGFVDGTVGAGSKDETTEVLNDAEELLELGVLGDVCPILADLFGICPGTTAEAFPEHLPWVTELTANGDLLGAHAGGLDPGWFILCSNGLENECTRTDTFLAVENLLSELEVDLGFKPLEEAICTNPLSKKGKVEGTVSVLLENGNGLQAM